VGHSLSAELIARKEVGLKGSVYRHWIIRRGH
jgi:hypothetical protein